MKQLAIVTGIALIAISGNAYWINNAYNLGQVLDKCAQDNNVYKCDMVPQPTVSPRVVYVKPDLLPPPNVKR